MRTHLAASVVALALTLSSSLLAQEVAPSASSSLLSHSTVATRTADPTIVREATVTVSANLLETAEFVTVDFFEGLSGGFLLTDLERRVAGDLAWRGRLEDGSGHATITVKSGVVIGLFHAFNRAYELTTDATGGQVLRQLDQGNFAPCANDHHADEPRGLPPMPETLRSGNPQVSRGATINIDLLGLYTPQARDAAGGASQIAATIQAAVDNTNTASINSNSDVRFTLVGTELVNYNDSGNIFTDRNWVQADPTANALRDQYGADLVGLIVQNGGGFCGVAFLMGNEDPAAFSPFGYQVTARGCAVGNLSFAHEHGHNIGLQHNPENGAPPASAVYPWSYGHYHNGEYRTVMSYSSQCGSGCTRITQWSNPDVMHAGLPTGVADQRDNERTLGLIAPFTALYRSDQLFTDGFESGNTSSWSASVP